ncbi:YaeQ family protein [Escherichia coli]
MMLRLLAWSRDADERLQFTRGLCADDEPEAWLRTITWALIGGLSWGCRMSGGLRKPHPGRRSGAVYR